MGGLSIATECDAVVRKLGTIERPGRSGDGARSNNADGLFPLPSGERARVRGLKLIERSFPLTPTLSAALPPPQGRGSQTEPVDSSSNCIKAANGGADFSATFLARYTSTVA